MDIKPPSDFTEQSTDDVASASWVYIDQTMTEPQFLMLPTAETAVFAKKAIINSVMKILCLFMTLEKRALC